MSLKVSTCVALNRVMVHLLPITTQQGNFASSTTGGVAVELLQLAASVASETGGTLNPLLRMTSASASASLRSLKTRMDISLDMIIPFNWHSRCPASVLQRLRGGRRSVRALSPQFGRLL